MQRVILHCDMNNFYASVECMLNPELKNKPVAVCGSVEERHGIVLAKNYAAKAFGVSTGEAIWQAKQKCQELVIVEPHYEQYMKFSKLVRGIYGRYTDQIEPYGMDECWLDVTGSGCMGTGFEIADEIRRTVKFELGLTISAGVSFNKIFAKLGSDMKKPDAITCIEADSFREKIWCLPASDLLGVGRATEKILSGYGIHTIGELAATSDDFLKCRLGKNGLAIKKYANGLDDSPVMRSDYVSPVKSIGHGITTMQDLENNAEVWCVMLELVQEIGTKLRTHKKKASGIAISIPHVLFYRHRIFLHRHAAPFLTFRRSGSVPAVRKEKRMYFDAKEFGKRLHDVRTSRGITQEELAVRLGLASKQHVSRMENGERSCSIDLLIELSCILHVSTDYLLMGSEPSKEEVKNDLLSIISELSTIAKKI